MQGPLIVLLALAVAGAAPLAAQEKPRPKPTDSCLECHTVLEHEPAKKFPEDIHYARGLTCAACHGGDPTAEDMAEAMSPARGYRGVPKRSEIPRLCARCHSDAAFMRAYNPSLRTDQLAQYWTSVHGRRLRQGDTRVAVCTDCHSVHDIRPATSPLSSVHPPNIPETCGRCHADAARMKPYKIATDQLAGYQASVHYQKLTGGDLSSPTCATCHGNHGAAPPGVASVERVCGTCHVFQEQLFDQSPHKPAWEPLGLPSCSTCHSNHRIEATGDFLVGTGDRAVCVTCHAEGDTGWAAGKQMNARLTELDAALTQAAGLLGRAERAGMDVSEARLTEAGAREKLIKARVDVHAFNAARVEETVGEGMKITAEVQAAGNEALAELAFRRKGLGLSLLAIAFVVFSLWLLIRHLERPTLYWSR
jgi:predicted CXXCH cytochrome family protein